MIAMVYGTLPQRPLFDGAFNRHCPDGRFSIPAEISPLYPNGANLTLVETWELIERACLEHNPGDPMMDLAGAILYTLGIEWI